MIKTLILPRKKILVVGEGREKIGAKKGEEGENRGMPGVWSQTPRN